MATVAQSLAQSLAQPLARRLTANPTLRLLGRLFREKPLGAVGGQVELVVE